MTTTTTTVWLLLRPFINVEVVHAGVFTCLQLVPHFLKRRQCRTVRSANTVNATRVRRNCRGYRICMWWRFDFRFGVLSLCFGAVLCWQIKLPQSFSNYWGPLYRKQSHRLFVSVLFFFSCVCFQTQSPSEQNNYKGNVSRSHSFPLVPPFWTQSKSQWWSFPKTMPGCGPRGYSLHDSCCACHRKPVNKLNCRVYDCWELDAVLCGALWLFLLLPPEGSHFVIETTSRCRKLSDSDAVEAGVRNGFNNILFGAYKTR